MQKEDLRIVFMGTPEFAVGTLSRLIDHGYNIVAVVTQPDRPVGRHQDHLQPSAVKAYAIEHGIPVMQPEKMKDEAFVNQLASYHADLQVVVAFRMLPEVVWAMPRFGTFNVHASLLPQYRGAAPINWAIINGETETGVTTFFLDHQIDTGRIILQRPFPIPADADAGYVHDGLMDLGAQAAEDTINMLLEGDGKVATTSQDQLAQAMADAPTGSAPSPQLHPAPKIFKDTCRISWAQPAKRVHDFIRGLSPYPGAWTTLVRPNGKEETLKILKATPTTAGANAIGKPQESGRFQVVGSKLYVACADSWLEILELQLSGKRRMPAADFLNGNKDIENSHAK